MEISLVPTCGPVAIAEGLDTVLNRGGAGAVQQRKMELLETGTKLAQFAS